MLQEKGKINSRFGAHLRRKSGILEAVPPIRGRWTMTCRDKDGRIKWEEDWENIIVDEGLNYLLDVGLSGAAQIATWYLALINDGETFVAGDTYAAHAGWTEFTDYSEVARPQWVDGGVSAKSVDNAASVASFGITSSGTIGGAALVSNSTKGDTAAPGAKLYAEGAFSTVKNVEAQDTLEVTATFTMADDGA